MNDFEKSFTKTLRIYAISINKETKFYLLVNEEYKRFNIGL